MKNTDEEIQKSEIKRHLGWRLARFFAALIFPFLCAFVGLGVAQMMSGQFGIGCLTLSIGALLSVASAVSVMWISKRSFPTASGSSYNGLMKAVGFVAILYVGLYFALDSPSVALWGAISAVSYLLVGLGGIWMLLRSRRFVWQKYAVVGVGIVALVLPIYIPQMQFMAGNTWARNHEDVFKSLIQEVEEAGLCTGNMLHDVVMHEIDLMNIQSIEASIIVLVAEDVEDVTDTESSLAISAVSGQLSKDLRAESPSDVRTVLIHGEPAEFRGAYLSHDLVAPVLLYSWPDKELVGSGRLSIGDMEWGITRGEAYDRMAEKIRQAANTNW